MPRLQPTPFPGTRPPSRALTPPSRAPAAGHRRGPVPADAKSCPPRREPFPGGPLPRKEPFREAEATPGVKGAVSAPFPGAARPVGEHDPPEAAGGPGRGGPRRALTQHEGAEAPGHALGQVIHIELDGVQGQRLLHGAAGTAAGRHPEPWETPAGRREAEEGGKGGLGAGPAASPGCGSANRKVTDGRGKGATLPLRMRGSRRPAGLPRHCAVMQRGGSGAGVAGAGLEAVGLGEAALSLAGEPEPRTGRAALPPTLFPSATNPGGGVCVRCLPAEGGGTRRPSRLAIGQRLLWEAGLPARRRLRLVAAAVG